MRFKKDSLLLKIVFYNDIAIILSSFTMALILMFIVFDKMENDLKTSSIDKISHLHKAYDFEMTTSKTLLIEALRNTFSTLEEEDDVVKPGNSLELLKENLIELGGNEYLHSELYIKDENNRLYHIKNETTEEIFEDSNEFKDRFIEKNYLFKKDGNIFSNVSFKYRLDKENYINATIVMPIESYSLERIREYIGLSKEDKVFLLVEGNYTFEQLEINKRHTEIKEKKSLKFKKNNYDYFTFKDKVAGKEYIFTMYEIYDNNSVYIGEAGLAISKEEINATEFLIFILVTAIALIFIAISTTYFAKLFKKVLQPITELISATSDIAKGEYNIDLSVETIPEIRTLCNSVKDMADKIKINEKKLKERNSSLEINLRRIEAVEKVLMGLNIEENFSTGIKGLLSALTSELGLGYSRAIYFRYSLQNDDLTGDSFSVNSRIENQMNHSCEEKRAFKFQIDDLETLIPFLKIQCGEDNLLTKSLKERRIIYKNDKAYKYNLGNDIFRSLGLKNFIILPIFSEDMAKGCILIDYFINDIEITQEEVELLTLFIMNISIRIKNKEKELEKIEEEKFNTIIRMSNRFLIKRESALTIFETFVEKIKHSDYNSGSIEKEIKELERIFSNIRNENYLLREYTNITDNGLEVIKIEKIISEATDIIKQKAKKYGIEVSVFNSYNAEVFVDKKKIVKAIVELLTNAIEAILVRNKLDKKINIMIAKEKAKDKIKIKIIDNGIGMTQEELSSLRGRNNLFRENDAFGLSFSVVSKIIREHKGIIKVNSQIDEGTEIKIILNIHKEEEKNVR